MKKGTIHSYTSIENFANEHNYSLTEHGDFLIGEKFIVLKHNEKDLTISFMLSSTNGLTSFYDCIYSDVN
jgi:hypothetical protein